MNFKANALKKFRRWLNQKSRENLRTTISVHNSLSSQVGKLLQSRGAEIITMTTL